MERDPKARATHGRPVCEGGEAVTLERDEQAVLQILRLMCLSYARPQAQSWEQALATATAAFGPTAGGEIAIAVMQLMRAIRVTRRTTFRFRDPGCSCCRDRLSDVELKVIGLLRAARQDPVRPARIDALILTEGGPTAAVIAEADRLAGLLHRRTSGQGIGAAA